MMYVQAAEDAVGTGASGIGSFVSGITGAITSNVSLADVATVVAAIVAAGIVAIVAWTMARKGYAYVKKAITGKGGKI